MEMGPARSRRSMAEQVIDLDLNAEAKDLQHTRVSRRQRDHLSCSPPALIEAFRKPHKMR